MENFHLSMNDFEINLRSVLSELLEDKDLFDVTLVCDDNQFEAHKLILAAFSPFFRNLLRKNRHHHPLVYLRGFKCQDLQAVVNFMYRGEAIIDTHALNSFLSVAEDLKVNLSSRVMSENDQSSHSAEFSEELSGDLEVICEDLVRCEDLKVLSNEDLVLYPPLKLGGNGASLAETTGVVKDTALQEMQNSEDYSEPQEEAPHQSPTKEIKNAILFQCPYCPKEYKSKDTLRNHKGRKHSGIRDHIQPSIDKNLEDNRHPCLCGKRFKSASGVNICRSQHKETTTFSDALPHKIPTPTSPKEKLILEPQCDDTYQNRDDVFVKQSENSHLEDV